MKSELRHSMQDPSAADNFSAAQQIGAHVVATAQCVGIFGQMDQIEPSQSASAILSDMSKSLDFFKENASLLDVLLNREPLYIATQILGIHEEIVDEKRMHTWPLYQDMQAAVLTHSDDHRGLYEALGNHIAGVAATKSVVRYEVVVDGMHPGE